MWCASNKQTKRVALNNSVRSRATAGSALQAPSWNRDGDLCESLFIFLSSQPFLPYFLFYLWQYCYYTKTEYLGLTTQSGCSTWVGFFCGFLSHSPCLYHFKSHHFSPCTLGEKRPSTLSGCWLRGRTIILEGIESSLYPCWLYSEGMYL